MRTSSISTVHASASPAPKAAAAASPSDGKFHAELGKAQKHATSGTAKPARAKQAKTAKGAAGRQAQAAKTATTGKGAAQSADDESSSDAETDTEQSTLSAKDKSNSLAKNADGKNVKTMTGPTAKPVVSPDDADEGDGAQQGQRRDSAQDGQKQPQGQAAADTTDQSSNADSDSSKKSGESGSGTATDNSASAAAWMGMALNSAGNTIKDLPRADLPKGNEAISSDASSGVSAFQAADDGSQAGIESAGTELPAIESDATEEPGITADPHPGKIESQIHSEEKPSGISFAALMQNPASAESGSASGKSVQAAHTNVATPTSTPETQFASTNHGNIVSGVRGQLLPNGGSMQIRLDPPELGALQVSVKMENGVLSASFRASSDEATKLLSHSLGQLKQTLEAQGVSVDRLHVQQGPRSESSGNKSGDDSSQQQGQAQERGQQQDQQRREMLRRMWAQVSGGDPLDLVA